MNKNVVILYENEKPVQICENKTITKVEDLTKLQKLVNENYQELKTEKEQKEQELKDEIANLNKEIKLIKLELALNRGEITEKEYNELCNGIK